MILTSIAFLGIAGGALAADTAATKPDCADKQKAVDDANAAVKTAGTPDLSSCKDKTGKDKTACEKPLKDKSKMDVKTAKDKVKETKAALMCCKDPKKKGCS
jgi:hypothetical protein